jgi:hypothetical protein
MKKVPFMVGGMRVNHIIRVLTTVPPQISKYFVPEEENY